MAQTYGTGMNNSARIRPIANFADAKERFDTVTPIRGRRLEVRPLGEKRSYSWYTINKNLISVQDPDEPLGRYEYTYSCEISDRKVVEFFSNGDIGLYLGIWKGPTLFGFLTYTLARDVGTVKSCNGKWYFINSKDEGFYFYDKLILSKDERNVYIPRDAKPEQKYSLNRKVMNALRSRYSFFTDYSKTCLSMNPTITKTQIETKAINKVPNKFVRDGVSFDKLRLLPYRYYAYDNESKLGRMGLILALAHYEQTQDLELLYELMVFVALSAGRYSWNTSNVTCDPDSFIHVFEEVLKYEYASSLFKIIEQPIGSIFNDKNQKYFNQ